MYAMIRRYTPKGAWDRKTLDEFKQRIEGKFVPRLQDIRGFHSYYVVNAGERDLVTIGIFEDQAGAAESSRRAAEFVKNDPLKDQFDAPRSSRASC
jgi:hypothetical protein